MFKSPCGDRQQQQTPLRARLIQGKGKTNQRMTPNAIKCSFYYFGIRNNTPRNRMNILLNIALKSPLEIPSSRQRTPVHTLFWAHLHPLSLGMYFASFILSPKGPDETCTQGSSGQQQFVPGLPAVLSPGTLPLPTVTRFDKFTLTFTWTHVLKFFLYKSRTWR